MNNPVKVIKDATSFSLANFQNALGYAVTPYLTEVNEVTSEVYNNVLSKLNESYFQMPLTFYSEDNSEQKKDSNAELSDDGVSGGFTLPFDPIISLSSKNIITRRYVNKPQRRGSIKERWSRDDWEINISGMLISEDTNELEGYENRLLYYCNAKESLKVDCKVLNEFGIEKVSIESYDFPFTKGVNNQAFTLKCYSDNDYTLLIS